MSKTTGITLSLNQPCKMVGVDDRNSIPQVCHFRSIEWDMAGTIVLRSKRNSK